MTDRRFCEEIIKNGGCCVGGDFGYNCLGCLLSIKKLGEKGCGEIGSVKAAEYWLSQNPAGMEATAEKDQKEVAEKMDEENLTNITKDYSQIVPSTLEEDKEHTRKREETAKRLKEVWVKTRGKGPQQGWPIPYHAFCRFWDDEKSDETSDFHYLIGIEMNGTKWKYEAGNNNWYEHAELFLPKG